VALAARGARNMDSGPESIEDEIEKTALRKQASGVRLKSAITALILTGIAVVLPTIN
jgi:hypothetical protein